MTMMNPLPSWRSHPFLSSLVQPFCWCCLFVIAVSLTGCTPRQMGAYRLETIGSELAVIPPPYADRSPEKRAGVDLLATKRAWAGSSNRCSIASGPFRLSRTPSEWRATFPSLQVWSRQQADGVFHQQFESFLDLIGSLRATGCISVPEIVRLREAMRQAIPTAVYGTLFHRHEYGLSRGFVELEPGMRLIIDRAEYNRSGKFRGTTMIYYRITRASKAQLRFRQVKVERHGDARLLEADLDVATRFRTDLYIRLFFSGNLVPENLNYAALLVGTRMLKRMEALSRALKAHPQGGCPNEPNNDVGVHCKPFFGLVTVSVELRVRVNSKKFFVGPQTDVQSILAKAGETACQKNPHVLRIERQFRGHPVRLVFDPATDSIMHLVVKPDDRIYCSAAFITGQQDVNSPGSAWARIVSLVQKAR